jgi:hypothetical protein
MQTGPDGAARRAEITNVPRGGVDYKPACSTKVVLRFLSEGLGSGLLSKPLVSDF